jgi:hydroxylamine reductase
MHTELKKYPTLKVIMGQPGKTSRRNLVICRRRFFSHELHYEARDSYINNVFTTSVVGYPGVKHIPEKNGMKDFSLLIKKALELGGWPEDKQFTGVNGGTELTTGFARNTVLGVADTVISSVKSGAIKHFFLVGGCDGAKPGRNYYTEFVKQTPADTIVLTLACGKYRFNDLNLGEIGGLPRLLDMGQCNAYFSDSLAGLKGGA